MKFTIIPGGEIVYITEQKTNKDRAQIPSSGSFVVWHCSLARPAPRNVREGFGGALQRSGMGGADRLIGGVRSDRLSGRGMYHPVGHIFHISTSYIAYNP